MKLRTYQKKAADDTLRLLNSGKRVCLVSPTGSGKTVMAGEIVRRARAANASVFAISHRHEINEQIGKRLNVQTQTIQTVCKADQGLFDHIDLVWFDECHHIAADKWSRATSLFPNARLLGTTATPVRSDGSPLGNWFDAMEVAAQYPELVRDGHLSPVRIVRPDECTAPDLAFDPIEAYKEYTDGTKAIVFAGTVEESQYISEQFNNAGIPSAHIDGTDKKDARALALKLLRQGGVQVLCNVFIATEGIDIPDVSTIVLARGCSSAATYLQMVGRALRPHPDKDYATLLDLTGVSWIHGSPIARRKYSLQDGIQLESSLDVVDCPQCAWCGPARTVRCPVCEWNFKENSGRKRKKLILSKSLEQVYAGIDTPPKAKAQEFEHLCSVAQKKGYSISWALRKYRDLFEEMPELDADAKNLVLEEELSRALERGHKAGSAIYRFKDLFGHDPNWNHWRKLKREYDC